MTHQRHLRVRASTVAQRRTHLLRLEPPIGKKRVRVGAWERVEVARNDERRLLRVTTYLRHYAFDFPKEHLRLPQLDVGEFGRSVDVRVRDDDLAA